MKKALITGIGGQDGTYLSRFLLAKNYEVHGLAKPESSKENLKQIGVLEKIHIHPGDITDAVFVKNLVQQIKPDEIYNLAALTFVPDSWKEVKKYNEVNYFGVINILDAIKAVDPLIRFCQSSTSEMFGQSHDGLQTEETPFHPLSPYAVSKLAAYEISNVYRLSYKMHCSNAICFNHESPLRPQRFVTRKVSLGVAKIKFGQQKFIELGDLDSVRDWGYAGDYVDAMWRMLQQKISQNFILSTGVNHSIKELLDIAFACVGIKDWEQYVKINKNFSRPVELKRLVGSNAKAKSVLGWAPSLQFESLVKKMVQADLDLLEGRPTEL